MARFHRRMSFVAQLNAIFVATDENATSCDFIAVLVQFVSAKRQCTSIQVRKQKLCACSKVKLLLKVTVFRKLHLKPWR